MALASKLKGHTLSLSLQMYGCRVIQKVRLRGRFWELALHSKG